jgi:hypothetical protein
MGKMKRNQVKDFRRGDTALDDGGFARGRKYGLPENRWKFNLENMYKRMYKDAKNITPI